jgi:hypothetical protein
MMAEITKPDNLDYCVIGAHAGRVASNSRRTWCATEAEAVEHARGLLRSHFRAENRALTLLVVKVVKVVEIGVPEVVVRDVTPSDREESE